MTAKATKDTPMTAKHTCGGPTFGRLTQGCPRCDELKDGAAPVRWANTGRRDEARRIAEIRAHDCKAARCGPICTFGDW